jgi:nucleoside-diphosphate-sugar epimerase
VGSGWLGSSIASAANAPVSARRNFTADRIDAHSTVFVASGRSSFPQGLSLAAALRSELEHLRAVLDACEKAQARQIVVLGSSDVAGLAPVVNGTSAPAPVSRYALVKAALEDECRLRAAAGLPVTSVRLAPVHGPGKARTAALVRLARLPVIPLPGGGRHSIGFVLLADAVRALLCLGQEATPPVVSVGGGHTLLRDLLGHLARAQGRTPRWVPVPAPASALRRAGSLPLPGSVQWLLRLSLPREVAMEAPVPVTPLPEAAAMLVATC